MFTLEAVRNAISRRDNMTLQQSQEIRDRAEAAPAARQLGEECEASGRSRTHDDLASRVAGCLVVELSVRVRNRVRFVEFEKSLSRRLSS